MQVRDDRFHSKEAEGEEGEWMSSQVMEAVSDVNALSEDQKQEVLKVMKMTHVTIFHF